MNTKKILLLLLCSCIFTGTFAQSNLTVAQKKFQDEIFQFLKEEGYSPTINVDNEISFKSEGDTHWIRIISESPFFVVFQRSGYTLEGTDGLSLNASLLACNEVNKELYAVKLYCTDISVVFNIELYTRSAEDFKYVFYKNLQVLAQSEKEFAGKYNEFKQNSTLNLSAAATNANTATQREPTNKLGAQGTPAAPAAQNTQPTTQTAPSAKLNVGRTWLYLGREKLSDTRVRTVLSDRPDLLAQYWQAKRAKNNSRFFLIAGGSCIVLGIGLLASDDSYDSYAAYGGAACMGVGGGSIAIAGILNGKCRLRLNAIASEYNRSHSLSYRNPVQLNLVASGNSAGLRLTF